MQYRTSLTLDRQTAQLLRVERFKDRDLGGRIRSWLHFIHTGEYYGLVGQTLAGAASAAAVLLVWTGLALALRRLSAWSRITTNQ